MVAAKLTRMKERYPQLAEQYGPQLVVNGKAISVREAEKVLGMKNTATKEFLRWYLSEYHPEIAQARKQKTWVPASLTVVPAPEEGADALNEAEGRTWVDERSGTVFTDLGPDYGLIVLTKGEFHSLRRDYSKLWGGGATSQADLAYKYRFPSTHAVEVFKRIHGLRQTSIPFTDTELEEDGIEAAVDKTLESRRQAFMLRLQQKEREAEKRDAEKWRTFELNAHLIAASIKPALPAPDNLEALLQPPMNPYALVVSLTDLHLGKAGYGADGKLNYTRQEAVRRAIAAVRDLLTQASTLR